MAIAARLPIAADRVGACVRTIEFVGLNLTDVGLRMQVRLRPDTPGAPLIDLLAVTDAAAEGVRLVGVDTTGAAPISTVKIRINETTMENAAKVPYAGEPGTASVLSYDLIGIFGNDKRRLMFGDFVALPTTYGADNAPAVPSNGASGATGSYTAWSAATLTFDNDLVRVSIDGAEIVGALTDRAESAAVTAQAWAESASAPAGGTTKSSKSWATEAAFAAAQANGNDPALLPVQDYFRPDRVLVGAPEAGVIFSGGQYNDLRYLILPAKALKKFQVNKTLGDVGGFNRVEFYSTSTISPGGYLGAWTDPAQTPVLTDLTTPPSALIVVFRFTLNRVIGADAFANSIDADFKILPPGTGSAKSRFYGRQIDKTVLNFLTGERSVFAGDSRIANTELNAPLRVCVETGMTLKLTSADLGGKSDVAKSGRVLAKALYRAGLVNGGDGTALTKADIEGIDRWICNLGFNDLFKVPPGPPTPEAIAAKIGTWTDPPSATISPAGVANAPTMCGKFRTIIYWLRQQNNRLIIDWASVFFGYDSSFGISKAEAETWIDAWNTQLLKLCRALGVGFFDWQSKSTIGQDNYLVHLVDGIHMYEDTDSIFSPLARGYNTCFIGPFVQYLRHSATPRVAPARYESSVVEEPTPTPTPTPTPSPSPLTLGSTMAIFGSTTPIFGASA